MNYGVFISLTFLIGQQNESAVKMPCVMAAYVLTIEPILSDRCYSVSVAGDSFSVPGISDARRTADLRSRDAKSPKIHHTKKKRSPMR